MLIRSQDKMCLTNMAQVTDIYCYESRNGECRNITAGLSSGETTHLGTYSTVEKTIKVLDMIEDAYNKCFAFAMGNDGYYHEVRENKVFQMPQDEEV